MCKRPATLFKNRLQRWCFHVGFAKFLRKPILHNTLHKKRSFLLNIFSVNVTKLQFPTFTEETLNRKLHFLCIDTSSGCFWFLQFFFHGFKASPWFHKIPFLERAQGIIFQNLYHLQFCSKFFGFNLSPQIFCPRLSTQRSKIINLERRIINF